MKKTIIVITVLSLLFIAAVGSFVFYFYPYLIKPARELKDAQLLYENGDYVLAALRFDMLAGYGERAKDAWLKAGEESFKKGELEKARTYYLKGGEDASVFDALNAAYYERGVTAYADNDRIEGENCFSSISYGSEYLKLVDPVRFSCGERLLNDGDLDSAEKVFLLCGKPQRNAISELFMNRAVRFLEDKEIEKASTCFARAISYSDDRPAALSRANQFWRSAGDKAKQAGDQELADRCYAHMSTAH